MITEASFLEFFFFLQALLVFVFSLFGLAFIVLHEGRNPGSKDACVLKILNESLPIPDWAEIRAFLSLLFGFLMVGLFLLYVIKRIPGEQFVTVFVFSKLILICTLLLLSWGLFYVRLRVQVFCRDYFLQHSRQLNFDVKASLQAASPWQKRLNIRSCIVLENNRRHAVFFKTTVQNADGVSGCYLEIPVRFLFFRYKCGVFVADEHLEFLLPRQRRA